MSDPPVRELLRRALGARAAARLARVPLRDLNTMSASDLVGSYGLSEPAAVRTAAVVEVARLLHTEPLVVGAPYRGSADVFRAYGARMRDLKVERFMCLALDGKHRLIREYLVSQGTLTSSPVHPREVFAPALRCSAAAIIGLHNHPSGQADPSADDLEISRRLTAVGDLIGVRLIDSIIIGHDSYVSLADRGLLA